MNEKIKNFNNKDTESAEIKLITGSNKFKDDDDEFNH